MKVTSWKHWPNIDLNADLLAKSVIRYQDIHDHCFIKLSCNSNSVCSAFGIKRHFKHNPLGTVEKNSYPHSLSALLDDKKSPKELNDCPQLLINIEAHKRVSEHFSNENKLCFATVYSPLYHLNSMLAGTLTAAELERAPYKKMLSLLSDITAQYIEALLLIKNVRIYYCSFHACGAFCSYQQFKTLVAPYDEQCIAQLTHQNHLLHYHCSSSIYFDYLDSNRFSLLSIDDCHDVVSIKALLTSFPDITFVGLLDKLLLPRPLKTEEIEQFLLYCRRNLDLNRVIIAPSCTLPVSIKNNTLLITCSIVKEL
ncbi:hypothetical protein H5162_09600 [Pseudoalteromonas sp. SR41-8]|uniref:uroporphyrinogen decarboxylase family protein n=1 Tax=Pseudoalteromonas sp. SR41-8 TaxID=2760946 RepID=UPI001600096F|nr:MULTISPECIES: uroporphyrinogen decarboxylase family protein [unclassified Pseudoalteromonas]MBB1309678.1 hypothetical protein [Pseudoalteromonas sp. SR41-8]MBB1397015.1 hypothetical protein [Pseudoalteromonas sp. SG44-8]